MCDLEEENELTATSFLMKHLLFSCFFFTASAVFLCTLFHLFKWVKQRGIIVIIEYLHDQKELTRKKMLLHSATSGQNKTPQGVFMPSLKLQHYI